MEKWLEYSQGEIFGDRSKNGLLANFLKDYSTYFGVSVCATCIKQLNQYYQNFYKEFTMAQEEIKCDYRLKAKYNGMQIGANGAPIRNGEMTNEIAQRLLEWHPDGENLFDIMPDDYTPKKDEERTLSELRRKYPEITANSKKKFLSKLKDSK